MMALILAASLIAGVPDSVTGDLCFRATDGAPGYDADGPIWHQDVFDENVLKTKLSASQTKEVERFCKDSVTTTRFIVMQGRLAKSNRR